VLFPRYSHNNKIKEDEKGRAYRTNGIREMHLGFWWESQKERNL
jgi:hypothetical protein